MEPLLRRIELRPGRIPDPGAFPFTLPVLQGFETLELHPEVTFLVGENGSGKSTVLEGIAAGLDLDVEGGDAFNVAREVDANPRLLARHGGQPLHGMSHGESFLALLNERFQPDGLFLLDEPEAALSPTGILALLRRMRELALDGAQFVVATHSPMLLAYPGALIDELGPHGLVPTEYEATDHYRVTRAFLDAPERFLRDLLA